jgi:hypothetical protein
MITTTDSYAAPQMKASDADRDAVLAVLSEHFQAGRLTSQELEERTGTALAARTHGELAALTSDLPGPVPAAGPAPAVAGWPGRAARPPLLPVVGVLALIAIAEVAVHLSLGRQGDSIWWAIPVAAIALRRIALLRGGAGQSFRRF